MFNKILAFIMSIIAALSGLFAPPSTPEPELGGSFSAGPFSGVAGDSLIFESDTPLAGVNSLVMREQGNSIYGFMLEAMVGDEYVLLTKGDTVSEYRFCAFDPVNCRQLRLTVTACRDSFSLSEITVGCSSGSNPDFKVVSYFVADSSNGVFDEGNVRATTDMIFFGIATFDENGVITLKREGVIAEYMAAMRRINPDIKLHLNILGPSVSYPDWNTSQEKAIPLYRNAMVKHRADFIANILKSLDEYGFDGIFFDWEYPVTASSKRFFSSFLVALKKALGERELGAALSAWCCDLSYSAKNALDIVAVMSYDKYDSFGYHASFTSAYTALSEFIKNGYKKEKLSLGLAFYARPTDGGAFWPSYAGYANELGKYNNVCKVDCGGTERDCYFNSPQLIRDKTAYAYLVGLGGVMTWHFACDVSYDSELSLYRAIDTATK